jgi:hypothetical protein
VRNRHELGECRLSKECIVCHFEIGYLKLHILGSEVFPCPEGHGKSDLADGGRRCSGDYAMEGSPVWTQRRSGDPHMADESLSPFLKNITMDLSSTSEMAFLLLQKRWVNSRRDSTFFYTMLLGSIRLLVARKWPGSC